LSLPFSWTRIPDYNDIAQSFDAYLQVHVPRGDMAVVTHSQGGLLLQRFLAWMLNEGRGRELARIKMIVMLSCPNEGSEYLRSIRAAARFGRHAQARDLRTLSGDVAAARRTVLTQIVNASAVNERECPIPIYVYAGSSDKVVLRTSAQGSFPRAGTLPGNHFSILDSDAPENITFPKLKAHLLEAFTAKGGQVNAGVWTAGKLNAGQPGAPASSDEASKFNVTIHDSTGIQLGDHNTQHNTF
jgi:hypothetical protein